MIDSHRRKVLLLIILSSCNVKLMERGNFSEEEERFHENRESQRPFCYSISAPQYSVQFGASLNFCCSRLSKYVELSIVVLISSPCIFRWNGTWKLHLLLLFDLQQLSFLWLVLLRWIPANRPEEEEGEGAERRAKEQRSIGDKRYSV